MNTISIHWRDSITSSLINGVINAAIALYVFHDKKDIPLSFGLGFILSLITSKIFSHKINKTYQTKQKELNFRFSPSLVTIAFENTLFLFGLFIAIAILCTKYYGVIMLPPILAAIVVGIFATLITVIVEVHTKQRMIYRKQNILEQA